MGWAKRTDGIAHAHRVHDSNLAILERVVAQGRARKLADVAAAIDGYLIGCQLVGRRANDDLIEACFSLIQECVSTLSWRTA